MIYRFLKKYHPVTGLISVLMIIGYTGTVEYHTEVRTAMTNTEASLIIWALAFAVPSILYVILDVIKKKYIDKEYNND